MTQELLANETAGSVSAVDKARTMRINAAVRAASRELRARHPWLKHQDGIGLTLLVGSVAGVAATATLYLTGRTPAWGAVLAIALFTSIAHEIEHDLIHELYFRRNRPMHALMMALCWIVRPITINPWIRRMMHLHHHAASGTETDLEERAITNGEEFGVRRLVMMGDGLMGVILRMTRVGKRRWKFLAKFLVAYFPLGWAHFALWYSFLFVHVARAATGDDFAPGWTDGHDAVVVVWIMPNVLRSFCLNFVSSNLHYYGNIQSGNVLEQTQVLNAPQFWPFQLFCFNFGGTHAIHHFVVNEPFYVRQWTAKAAHAAMRDNGVPFNDLGTFRRANRRAAA